MKVKRRDERMEQMAGEEDRIKGSEGENVDTPLPQCVCARFSLFKYLKR